MISILSWNDGYETHDTKKTKGRLSWVRQNILISDVCWAKLWLKPDAALIWAGWTAIVWCAAQSDVRGTITNVEDVSILSRVPESMVEAGLDWGISCGFAVFGDPPANLPQHSRQSPANLPQTPETFPTTERNGTVRDETTRNGTIRHKSNSTVSPREWPRGVDPSRQPSKQVFLDAIKSRFPAWQPGPVSDVYDIWHDNGWKDGNGARIENWQALAAIWYSRADQCDKFERMPPGSFFPGAGGAVEALSASGGGEA